MGAAKSKQGGQVLNTNAQIAQQPSEPPYYGPSAQYHFLNTQVTIHASYNFGHNMVSSNVDSYYPSLAAQYAKGFRMLTFYHIPGQTQHAGGLFTPSVVMPFQGIFCRYPQAPPSNEQYQLYIEKSIIQPEVVWNGFLSTTSQTVTNTSHLHQTIMNNAVKGARLICIELTGQEQHQHGLGLQMRYQQPMMGCDLFFEMPMHPPSETYVYNVLCEPIHVAYQGGFAPRPVVQCNWAGILAANLGQGWKLVEIFMDSGKTSQARGFSATMQLNSQWFFEKPASRINDPTPVYQGTYVEHTIKIRQAGFSGTRTDANWEPIIQNMGNKGWELACILETPEQTMSGFASIHMKVLLFFQRKIIPDVAGATAMPFPQPPPAAMPYPEKPGFQPPPPGQFQGQYPPGSQPVPPDAVQGQYPPGSQAVLPSVVQGQYPPGSQPVPPDAVQGQYPSGSQPVPPGQTAPPPSYDSLGYDPNAKSPHAS